MTENKNKKTVSKKGKVGIAVLAGLAIAAGFGIGGYKIGRYVEKKEDDKKNGEVVSLQDRSVAIKCAYKADSSDKYGAYELTYSVTPTVYTDDIGCKLAFSDGTNVNDTVVSVDHNTTTKKVTVHCKEAFTKQITLTLYAVSNPSVCGTMKFDFKERITVTVPDSITVSEGKVPTVATTVSTTGGTVTVDKTAKNVKYTWNSDFLAWVRKQATAAMKEDGSQVDANCSYSEGSLGSLVGLSDADATKFFSTNFSANTFLTTKGCNYTYEWEWSDDDSDDPWNVENETFYLGEASKTEFQSEFNGTKPVIDWSCTINGVPYAKSFGLKLSTINVTSITLDGTAYTF